VPCRRGPGRGQRRTDGQHAQGAGGDYRRVVRPIDMLARFAEADQPTRLPAVPAGQDREARCRLFSLSQPARSMLVGTARRPSLVAFAVKSQPVDDRLRRRWRRGLSALAKHVSKSWPDPQLGSSERVAGSEPCAHEPVGAPGVVEAGSVAATKPVPETRQRAPQPLQSWPCPEHASSEGKHGPEPPGYRSAILLRASSRLTALERGQESHRTGPPFQSKPAQANTHSDCPGPRPQAGQYRSRRFVPLCQHQRAGPSIIAGSPRPIAGRRTLEKSVEK
jgi:hypothetical protein